MFSMYDDDGLNFRNNIDHLYKVNEISPSQKIKNRTNDENKKEKQDFQETLYKGQITKEATNAYKEMTHLDTRVDIYHVEQIMSHTVITVDDNKTIIECYKIMKEHHIQQLPIIAENKLHLKGIITRLDILNHLANDLEFAKEKADTPIYELSTKKIITTDPISDIRRVAQVMVDLNLNAIPVVTEEDILVGIVSRNDIMKAVASLPHLQLWA